MPRASLIPAAIREWVEDALKWHETFADFVAKLGRDVAYLNSLDFDELMESLDIEERRACRISDLHDPGCAARHCPI